MYMICTWWPVLRLCCTVQSEMNAIIILGNFHFGSLKKDQRHKKCHTRPRHLFLFGVLFCFGFVKNDLTLGHSYSSEIIQCGVYFPIVAENIYIFYFNLNRWAT